MALTASRKLDTAISKISLDALRGYLAYHVSLAVTVSDLVGDTEVLEDFLVNSPGSSYKKVVVTHTDVELLYFNAHAFAESTEYTVNLPRLIDAIKTSKGLIPASHAGQAALHNLHTDLQKFSTQTAYLRMVAPEPNGKPYTGVPTSPLRFNTSPLIEKILPARKLEFVAHKTTPKGAYLSTWQLVSNKTTLSEPFVGFHTPRWTTELAQSAPPAILARECITKPSDFLFAILAHSHLHPSEQSSALVAHLIKNF